MNATESSRRRFVQSVGVTIGLTAGTMSGTGIVSAQSTQKDIGSGRVELIEPDEGAEFNYPYLLYRPDADRDYERPLYVKPHNSPEAKNREALREQLIGEPTAARHPTFVGARRNRYPGIIPGFPRTPNDGPDYIQTMSLPSYRSELFSERYRLEGISTEEFSAESLKRVDTQLIGMIEDAKSRLESEPYTVADKIHMSGFSASTTFSNRFAFLYPDRVRTLTTGGSTVLPLPKASHNDVSLPYPLGTADYEEFTGRTFDTDAWADINRYIYVGQEDQPLPSNDTRGYFYGSGRYQDKVETVYGKNRVTERFPFVKSEYEKVTDAAKFRIFDGVGHRMDSRMRDAVTAFNKNNSPTPNPEASDNSGAEGDNTSTDEPSTESDSPGFGLAAGIVSIGSLVAAARFRTHD